MCEKKGEKVLVAAGVEGFLICCCFDEGFFSVLTGSRLLIDCGMVANNAWRVIRILFSLLCNRS